MTQCASPRPIACDSRNSIHALEAGTGARMIKTFAVILGFGALAMCYDMRAYRNFNTQEAMDAGQLAHNIAMAADYTTEFIRPLAVHLFETATQIPSQMGPLDARHQ